MAYEITFDLNELPPMPNKFYAGMHFSQRKKLKDQFSRSVFLATAHIRPSIPLKKYKLVLTRFSASEPDYDGLVGSFKVVVDGLVTNGILANDKLSMSGPWEVHWNKVKREQGFIRIKVIAE